MPQESVLGTMLILLLLDKLCAEKKRAFFLNEIIYIFHIKFVCKFLLNENLPTKDLEYKKQEKYYLKLLF